MKLSDISRHTDRMAALSGFDADRFEDNLRLLLYDV